MKEAKAITTFFIILIFCAGMHGQTKEPQADLLKNFDSLAHSTVMILGTFHFDSTMLAQNHQSQLSRVVSALAAFHPTKVVLEWEPSRLTETNRQYRLFLRDSFDISDKPNEIYQIGFKVAKALEHDSVYLFDDQTEYIGSLDNFSFRSFNTYARQNDDGFYNKYENELIETWEHNQSLLDSHSLYDRLMLMNSPQAAKINAQRMHLYEVRVGIQKNWMGPDWLGRWYRRNVRMMSNVLKLAEEGDRILIIVGDNHKWTLDMLFEHTPDFELESSWHLLQNYRYGK